MANVVPAIRANANRLCADIGSPLRAAAVCQPYLLTAICSPLYSGEMMSEILSLTAKVNQLAELAQTLRRENAELRLRCVEQSVDIAELTRRMEQAHQRVALLLEKLPAPNEQQEVA